MGFAALLLGLGGVWRRLAGLLRDGARWVGGSAVRVWAVAALLGLGLALWQYGRAAHWATAARQTQAAWMAERKAAAVAKAAAETRYRSLADDADARYAAALAQGNARLAAYLAAHRLRAATPAHSASAAADQPAALSGESAPGPVMAAISAEDLRICDANYAYASAAHEWAMGLGR